MEQDEPGTINIAGASTKVDGLKKENACFFLKLSFCSFTNNLNLSERVSFAKKSSSSKAVQRNSKARIKAFRQPTVYPIGNWMSSPIFRPLTGLTQVVERDVSSELSELDDPAPKKKAKAANKVRSNQLLYFYFWYLLSLQEPKTSKTKVRDKKMKSTKSSPSLTKDEETVKRLKVWGLYILATRRLLNPSLHSISLLSSLVVYAKSGQKCFRTSILPINRSRSWKRFLPTLVWLVEWA